MRVGPFVRLAVLKALPSDEELGEFGFDNAGAFLLEQAASDPVMHKAFLRSHCVEWGKLPEPVTKGWRAPPVAWKLNCLIEWIIVVCQGGLARAEDAEMVLTVEQVRRKLKPASA